MLEVVIPKTAKDASEVIIGGSRSYTQSASSIFLLDTLKQLGSFGIDQYANLTGNYTQARAINSTWSIASEVATMAHVPIGIAKVVLSKGMEIGGLIIRVYN